MSDLIYKDFYFILECVCVLIAQLCQLLATLWTVACQAPLSMDSPGRNARVGCHFLPQYWSVVD